MVHTTTAGPHDAPAVVVFVHGSMDRGATFARVIGLLKDLRTVRYDRRGYGRSVDLGPGGVGVHADDLQGVIEDATAGRDDRRAVVVGHSLGGVVALVAAQRRPDLVGAVAAYEAPMPWLPSWPTASAGGVAMGAGAGPADTGAAAERFLRRMIGDERWEALAPGLQAERRREGAALVAELASVRTGAAPYDIAEVIAHVPVLVGRGTESAAHHLMGADELAGLVGRAPVVIEGAGHGAHLSHRDAFAAFVRAAVALVPPR